MSSSQAFTLRALCAASLALAYSTTALAGGFDLPTIVASHQGTSNANGAEANDPSVLYYNPAGLTRLRGLQVSQGFSLLALRGKVETLDARGTPQDFNNPNDTGRDLSMDPNASGSSGSFWPKILGAGGLFVSMPVDDMLTVGLGVFAPAGGNLNYKSDWSGAYQIDSIATEVININPSVGIRFDDKHSIGLGVSVIVGHLKQKTQIDVPGVAQYLLKDVVSNASLDDLAQLQGITNIICTTAEPLSGIYGPVVEALGGGNTGNLCKDGNLGILPSELQNLISSVGASAIIDPTSRGSGTVEMYGYGFGYNLGYMYNFSDSTRMGIAYRSESKIKYRGDLEWDLDNIKANAAGLIVLGALGSPTLESYLQDTLRQDTTAKANFKLPARISVNFFHKLNEKIDLLMDYTFIETSIIDNVRVNFSNRINKKTGETVVQGAAGVDTKWKDSFKVSIGANYHLNEKITLKTGFQFDKTPVPSPEFRHPGLPDSDRFMYSIGLNYKVKDNLTIDGAYSYVFLEDSLSNYRDRCRVTMREDTGASCTGNGGSFTGKFSDTSIQVLSLQLNQKF